MNSLVSHLSYRYQALLVTKLELVNLDVLPDIPEISPCSAVVKGIRALLLNYGPMVEFFPHVLPSSPL